MIQQKTENYNKKAKIKLLSISQGREGKQVKPPNARFGYRNYGNELKKNTATDSWNVKHSIRFNNRTVSEFKFLFFPFQKYP